MLVRRTLPVAALASAALLAAAASACGSTSANRPTGSTAATPSARTAAVVKATLTMKTHTPTIKKKWYYVVRVTVNGKPARAKLTMSIIDPIGGVHGVQFGPSNKYIRNWPIKGVFRDYMIFPAESRGIPLVMRATLVTAKGRAVARYKVVPR